MGIEPKEPTRSDPTTATNQVAYEDAFEQTGYGSFSYLATIGCSLIFIHSLMEMVAIAFIITPAECDLKLTVGQKSLVNSAVFIGIMITAICWGVTGDKLGRRRIMLPAVCVTVVSSFISSLCSAFWLMFLFRLLTGVLVSASSAMVLVYLAELLDNEHRDRSLTCAIAAAQLTFAILPALAWVIIPQNFSFKIGPLVIRSWRVFMWLWGVVGLSGATILFFLPESPRYIYAAKGSAKTLPILARIYRENHKKDAPPYPVKSLADTNVDTAVSCGAVLNDLSQIMKAPMRRCVILTHFAMFSCFLLTNGLYMWLPDFLNAALAKAGRAINMCGLINEQYMTETRDNVFVPFFYTVPSPHGDEDCSKSNVNWIVYPIGVGLELFYLIPFITIIIVINKYSKIWLYAIIMWSCSIALLLCIVIPQCMVSMAFLVLGLACGSCCCILTAMAVDAFPTSLRGLATCTMYMAGQLGAVVGTSILGLMRGAACYVIFILLALVCGGSGFALVFLWPNIKEVRKIMESRDFNY